ncbi:L,D-transpeptidase family protein [Allosphingosinicella sp.]|jgi:lipoprotein-anchoring transpeptidase ErfK/SrfK|uniref:L,D-transpeptidase family protein n=1 Tax=Allosphingosinicella sp. TaxID=2823234 RepID=UPI002F00EEA3
MKMPFTRRTWIPAKLLSFAAAVLILQAAPSAVPAQQPTAAASSSTSASAPVRISARPAHPARPAPVTQVQVVSELAIDHWLRPGEFAWNDEGVPPGETTIVVNIRARVLSVYRGGIEIGRSSIIYGADNKPTPHGTFPILEKDADHVSNLYDAPMPHMLRLTWDGVAIHGSPELGDTVATRGCVGLPREFAALLFPTVDVGDRVIIWSGQPTA